VAFQLAEVSSLVSYPQYLPGYLGTQPVERRDQRPGVGVVVIDSGISPDKDFTTWHGYLQLIDSKTVNDIYGHGTALPGSLPGNGIDSDGFYTGIAPGVASQPEDQQRVRTGLWSTRSKPMQWVLNNKAAFNIGSLTCRSTLRLRVLPHQPVGRCL
jgi:hypothetical protein